MSCIQASIAVRHQSVKSLSQSATINLDGGNKQHWQFILQDLLGRTVAQYSNEGEVSLAISRNNLPAGLYIGVAKDNDGQMLGRTKIVVQ